MKGKEYIITMSGGGAFLVKCKDWPWLIGKTSTVWVREIGGKWVRKVVETRLC